MAARKKKRIERQIYRIAKGLTNEQALKVAHKRATRDFRGINYDPSTGELILI